MKSGRKVQSLRMWAKLQARQEAEELRPFHSQEKPKEKEVVFAARS